MDIDTVHLGRFWLQEFRFKTSTDTEADMARRFDIEPLELPASSRPWPAPGHAHDAAAWHELYAAWLKFALLIFPGQHLSRAEQIAFAKRFGPLEFDLAPISNVDRRRLPASGGGQ